MAHELTIENGVAEMAYVGNEPWHGLGQRLTAGVSIEEWQVAAGMAWKIRSSRVRYNTENFGHKDFEQITLDDDVVLFRGDTHAKLSIVSSSYKPVQPGSVLEFFRDLCDENGFILDTAGTLFGGRRFWAQAIVGDDATIVGNDSVRQRLLLTTSCDGTRRTEARYVAERVVCNNTLTMALKEKGNKRVSVSHRSEFNPESVKAQLGIAQDGFKQFIDNARKLSKVAVDNTDAEKFLARLLKTKTNMDNVENSAGFKSIMNLFQGSAMGGTLLGVQGTAWGLLNAVTEHVDHHARAGTRDARIDSAWFGKGDALKTEALELLLAE